MVKQAVRRKGTDATSEKMPLWAEKLIERFDHFSTSLERSLTDSFERIFGELASIHRTQSTILTRLSELEKKVSCKEVPGNDQQNLLYSTLVKIQTDGELINEKSRRIAWIGIDEQIDEESTRRFDHEIVKEAVHTSGDQELIREFEEGRIVSHRHPPGKPRGPAARGRIIKIALSSQDLRDRLLAHMKSSRQSLTQRFVHSFARRDYTVEELSLDRALRKQAGDLNAQEGKLAYIVRDFNIVRLKVPRDLPTRHQLPTAAKNPHSKTSSNNLGLPTRTDLTCNAPSATNYTASPLGLSQVASSQYSSLNSPNQL
ncbi:hypothetical protein Y032_0752g2055 [Ancylostoma ceylanicum]|uniref:Uncharacterized protein n=1 Tax=Ancylostoma ceylanicum TaxID=53326 RepID=A0A016WDT7_9BILA|nr:hypothetical protein Y032_0752g2055 [Ancylostoma ceylanicum]